MKKLSETAGLSKGYTNHCIRATVISNLDNAGFEARHIRAVSGHKSDETIKAYAVRCPEVKKKEMSDALSTKLKEKKQVEVPTSTITRPQPDYPTINFEDIIDYVPIENNAEDFDIASIIKEVDGKNTNIPSENAVVPVNPLPQPMQFFHENIQIT